MMKGMRNTKKRKQISSKKTYITKIDIAILSIVFVMLVVLLIGLWAGTDEYKSKQLLMIQDTMEVLVEKECVQFENYIEQKYEVLQGLAAYPEIYEMDMVKQSKFIKAHSRKLGFHHLFVISEDGSGFYPETGEYKIQKGEPFYDNVMDNEFYVTEPFYGADATTMTICVSIYDGDYKKCGALCGAVELNVVQELFAENRTIQDGKSYLVNREGRYVAVEDMQQVYEKMSIYDQKDSDYSLVQAAFDEKANQSGTIMEGGTEYQANVAYLANYDWAIVHCIETEKIFKDLRYIDFWKYAALGIVLVIILCVIRIAVFWHKSEKKGETDVLTGCRSRASMEKLLAWLDKEKQSDITIVYLDLNKFKEVNDTYGHDKGDVVLCIFSDVLTEVFGETGYVGRLGGDEFVVVLQNTTEEYVAEMCNEVGIRLKEKSKDLEFGHIISTSYGYATRRKGSRESLDDIITKADEKMYQNKKEGRGK